MNSFYIKLLSIIIISCLGIVVYFNTFFCSFHFDDSSSIVDNFLITNIYNLQNIWNFWPCRFILYLSVALNYHFNGLNVFGYHLFNIVVHLGAAILVWWLTLLTLSTPAMKEEKIAHQANVISLFVGLVFIAHPIQTEAVTYIVQRAASMGTLFYLASLCLYVQSRLLQDKDSSWRLGRFYYICSLVTAIMAMFTKETAITLPLMILLYEFSFLKSRRALNWRHLVPFLLTIFIIPLTMLLTKSVNFQEMRRVTEVTPGISSMHYLLTQFRVMVTYIRLAFLPLNQNLDYDYPIFKNIFELPVLFSFLFLITILFWAKRLFLKFRLVSFSIFWFFLTLLPESSILPIKDVIYEHRLYLPLVGYSMFLVSSGYYLLGKNTLRVMVVVLTMIIFCYSVLTYQRNKVWKDEITLWDDVVSKSPNKARPHYNRGSVWAKQDDFSKAMSDYNKAIEINPGFAEAYNNRGDVYSREDNSPQALSDYNKAIEINPIIAKIYNNRGLIYYKLGNYTQALSDYSKAIEIDPKIAEVYNNRGNVYGSQGDLTQAMSDFNKAIEINPNYSKAYNNRGHVYLIESDFTQAVRDLTKAIELNPKDVEAYNNRAVSYYALGEYDKAWADVHKEEELGAVVKLHFINELKQASDKDR